jgi:hypothetical protein
MVKSIFLIQQLILPSGFQPKTLYGLLVASIHAMCVTYLILLDFIIPIIYGNKQKLWSSSSCSFLRHSVPSLLWCPNILLYILFLNTLSLSSVLLKCVCGYIFGHILQSTHLTEKLHEWKSDVLINCILQLTQYWPELHNFVIAEVVSHQPHYPYAPLTSCQFSTHCIYPDSKGMVYMNEINLLIPPDVCICPSSLVFSESVLDKKSLFYLVLWSMALKVS